METVLKVGIIVLPLVMFLAIFGNDISSYFQERAGATQQSGTELNTTAGSSGFGN